MPWRGAYGAKVMLSSTAVCECYAEPMRNWIALIGGINVGGRNRLPMKDLSKIFETAGCQQVKTYIQSGNVAFNARISSVDRFNQTIGKAIDKEFGFRPAIQLLSAETLQAAIASNPYPQAAAEPKSLHLVFLERAPDAEHVRKVDELLSGTESYTLTDDLLYFYAPDGIGRSKFAGRVDKVLHVNSTARNWRTITELEKLISA